MVYGVLSHFQQYVSFIMAVGFIGGGNQSTMALENNWPVAYHWQTFSHNVSIKLMDQIIFFTDQGLEDQC